MEEGDFNENICCPLCKSYFIDAVTLTDCLHSFCRSCLLDHFEKQKECPECPSKNGEDQPVPEFTEDISLQKLVYKMVPEVYWREFAQRRDFVKQNDDKRSSLQKDFVELSSKLCASNERISLCLEYISNCSSDPDDEKAEGPDLKPSTVAEADRIEKEVIINTFKRYFRCPAKTTVGTLRKLLEMKLEVQDTHKLFFVDIDCNSVLDDCCTLQDITFMFSWDRKTPMTLFFTLQRHLEEEKPPVLDKESLPELVAEEEPPSLAQATSISPNFPALRVTLDTSVMEKGAKHHPIITANVHGPPRKRRKPSSPTKKQKPASPVPVQRMTGVSPLAKGPPPVAQSDHENGTGKKLSPKSASTPKTNRVKAGDKSSSKSVPNDGPPAKQSKIVPLVSSENQSQPDVRESQPNGRQLNDQSTVDGSTNEKMLQMIEPQKSQDDPQLLKKSFSNGDIKKESNESTPPYMSQQNTTDTISTLCTTGSSAQSQKGTGKSSNAKSFGKLHTISSITDGGSNSSTTQAVVNSTATISHHRPIQPKPDTKCAYDTFLRNYAVGNFHSKIINPFAMDGKFPAAFAPAVRMQPSLLMDPKMAAKPIKQFLAGRGFPLVPETSVGARGPIVSAAANLAGFMHQLNTQPTYQAINSHSCLSIAPKSNDSKNSVQSTPVSSHQLTSETGAVAIAPSVQPLKASSVDAGYSNPKQYRLLVVGAPIVSPSYSHNGLVSLQVRSLSDQRCSLLPVEGILNCMMLYSQKSTSSKELCPESRCVRCKKSNVWRIRLRQCDHFACIACIIVYLKFQITEQQKARIKCIGRKCPRRIHENDIDALLDEQNNDLNLFMSIDERQFLLYQHRKNVISYAFGDRCKQCPLCKSVYSEFDGCHYVRCANLRCKLWFCWVCNEPITSFQHFTASNCKPGWDDIWKMCFVFNFLAFTDGCILFLCTPLVGTTLLYFGPIFMLFLFPYIITLNIRKIMRKTSMNHPIAITVAAVFLYPIFLVVAVPLALGSYFFLIPMSLIYAFVALMKCLPCVNRVFDLIDLLSIGAGMFGFSQWRTVLRENMEARRLQEIKQEQQILEKSEGEDGDQVDEKVEGPEASPAQSFFSWPPKFIWNR